jgi:hypothetical protein
MVLLAACLAGSCSSKKGVPPPAPATTGGTPSRSNDGGDATGNSMAGDRAAGGGAAGDPFIGSLGGELPFEPAGGASSDGPPSCDPSAHWGKAQVLAELSTPEKDETLLAMTHDELTVAFSRGSELFVADRSDPGKSFDAPIATVLPAGYGFAHGLSLSPDGLRLVAVSDDQRALAEVSREARGKTFAGKPNTSRFAWVNANLTQSGLLSSPVLSADDRSLILTRVEGPSMSAFSISGDHFDVADQLDPIALAAHDGKLKLTQSLSADSRTLFVFDEALGQVVGYWSTGTRAAFTQPVPLPGLLTAFTNVGCDRLYATVAMGGSLDVVSLSPQ